MKILVLTDAKGKILGTMRRSEQPSSGSSHEQHGSSSQIVPGRGQKVTEIDVPNDVIKDSAEEFHKALASYLKGK